MTRELTNYFNGLLDFDSVLFKNFFQDKSVFDSIFRVEYHYPVDIYTKNSSIYIDIAAVGLSKEDIVVEVKNNILKVSSNKTEQTNTIPYIHKGLARRAFNFGWKFNSTDIKLQELEVKLDKGLLSIKIPVEKELPKQFNEGFKKVEIK